MRRVSASPALAGTFDLLRLLPAVSRRMTVSLALGIVLQTALPLGFMVASGRLVGAIPGALHFGFSSPSGRTALLLLGVAAALIAAQRVLAPFVAALAAVFGRRMDRYLQERVMLAVGGPTGIEHLEDPEVLDLLSRVGGIGMSDTRPGLAIAALASLLPSWLQALGGAVILMTFRPYLGLVWIALWPIVLYYLQREYIRVGETASGQAAAVRRAGYLRDLALTPGPGKEVRIWEMTEWLVDRFDSAWRRVMEPVWQARNPGRAVVWLSAVAVAGAYLATLGLLAHAAVSGALTLGALAVYLQATVAAGTFRAFDNQNMDLAFAAIAVPGLHQLERRLCRPPETHRMSLLEEAPSRAIHFEDVSFRYPGAAADTLRGIDLEIPAGRSLAIVGTNGAGKTTLVKLLCGLYEPTDGRITVDCVDLRDVDPRQWRAHIAAIFQDFVRYHLSARDNVALGAVSAAGDESLIARAAERAGARGVVEALPAGWQTVLSRQYAGGVDLSGGQWQRIALARALFAVEAGARVLVLDEPTAALDVRAEAELYDRFLEITAGLTTILISHRFSTVRRADHIVVLDAGTIVEAGSHDELVARGGVYAEMFRFQADRFVTEAR